MAHLALGFRYRFVYDHVDTHRVIGLVLDEEAEGLPGRAVDSLLASLEAGFTPVTDDGERRYLDLEGREDAINPTARYYLDKDGNEYPVAIYAYGHLVQPGVSMIAVSRPIHGQFHARMYGLSADGLVISTFAPMVAASTVAKP